MIISLRGCVARASGIVIAACISWGIAAQAQNTAVSPVIPAPPGNAQQDLEQTDHAFDAATGHHLVWDGGKKSWIDMQSGQAVGFQGAVAKDGTVIPAPAPSIAKSGAKSQATQDPNNPERAYNAVTGQTLVWDRAQSGWIDTRSQKNVGFQGAFAPGVGAPAGAGGVPVILGLGAGLAAGGGNNSDRDRGGNFGNDTKLGNDDKRGADDRGGGVTIPIIIPVTPGPTTSNPPPPLQPSGGHTVSPPTPPANPPTQTAVNPPPPEQPPTTVTPPPAPGEAICGPVVTEKLFATLAQITRDFHATPGEKAAACHNLYGPTSYNTAWDINGLDPSTSPGAAANGDRDGPAQAKWNPATGTWVRTANGGGFSAWLTSASKYCAIPRPDDACAATVQFMGTCQHAQVVNYAMWGRVNKLCSFPLSKARAAVRLRGLFSDDEMKERQLALTNIGYAANAADEVQSGFLTTPPQFQKCQLKCPIKLPTRPPWSYIWDGLY